MMNITVSKSILHCSTFLYISMSSLAVTRVFQLRSCTGSYITLLSLKGFLLPEGERSSNIGAVISSGTSVPLESLVTISANRLPLHLMDSGSPVRRSLAEPLFVVGFVFGIRSDCTDLVSDSRVSPDWASSVGIPSCLPLRVVRDVDVGLVSGPGEYRGARRLVSFLSGIRPAVLRRLP